MLLETRQGNGSSSRVVRNQNLLYADFRKNFQISGGHHVRARNSFAAGLDLITEERAKNFRRALPTDQPDFSGSAGNNVSTVEFHQLLDLRVQFIRFVVHHNASSYPDPAPEAKVTTNPSM